MKTFAVFLCLIATTADAAPLYLRCDGKGYDLKHPEDAEQISQSIRIDGTNLWFEGGDPALIISDDEDVLTFAGGPNISHGTLNHITGRVEVMFRITESYITVFEGVCHKTEKQF